MNNCFFPYFVEKNERIKKEYILHATVLCWGYYIRSDDLTFDVLKSQLSTTSWLSFLADGNSEISNGEKKYQSIATNLKLSASKLDSHIIYFLEHGYIDDQLLKSTIADMDSEIQGHLASDKLNEAWSIYSDSLSDNFQEFKTAIENVLNEEISRLGVAEFSSAIDILSEFGDDVSKYINDYVGIHSDILTQMNSRRAWETTRISNQQLKDKISELEIDKLYLNIDDVAARIAKNKGWDPEDIEFLCTISKNEYIEWIKSEPKNLVYKVRGGLLLFRNISTSDSADKEKFETISNNVIEALRDISSENDFNKKRIKFIYEVE